MTLYHFGNCIALLYAPYHMAYKFAGMSEIGAWWRCVQCGAMFLLTALCKMLFLATFFPDTEPGNFTHEILRSVVDFADYIGMYVALNSVPGKGHHKIFTVALGWGAAEAVCSRGVALWVGARSAEFSWRWLRVALGGNLALLHTAAAAGLLWAASSSSSSRHPRAPRTLPALLLAGAGVLSAGGAGEVTRAGYAALCAAVATKLYADRDAYYGY